MTLMNPVKFVKICGITRLEDAQAAVAAGANALGFVFWPKSPRYVDPDRARDIVATLPPGVTPVGVFVDQPEDEVNDVARLVKLAVVQLHGNENDQYVRKITGGVMKAVAVDGTSAPSLEGWPSDVRILLDVHDPLRKGGTGRTIDWSIAADIARRRDIVLAGGLTPENIRDAIAQVRPYGIDVSSGVEASPGIKDHERIKALFEAVHGGHYATRS
jgi:phosphoribosylanthranilate isomerase